MDVEKGGPKPIEQMEREELEGLKEAIVADLKSWEDSEGMSSMVIGKGSDLGAKLDRINNRLAELDGKK